MGVWDLGRGSPRLPVPLGLVTLKGGGGEREKEQPYPSFGKVILTPTIGHRL